MLHEIAAHNLSQLKNKAFSQYAQIYIDIQDQYLIQLQDEGIALATYKDNIAEKRDHLLTKGVTSRNGNKSLYTNWISSACEACRKGEDSLTFYISLKCHRHCYYCFNPNQEEYAHFKNTKRDCLEELAQLSKSGRKLTHISLTGGEPLLHKQEMLAFFAFAMEKFPRAHTRLYTSGDLLDQATLQQLRDVGLQEIRFSLKLEDKPEDLAKIYHIIALSTDYIKDVMVEMPVIPGTLDAMKDVLIKLDQIGVRGINLLEFCYPFHNLEEFQKRGFKIKNPPFIVLYNYWYAGGLPVAGSATECLALLEFTVTQSLKLGVHYCSLENKHTGQLFNQNHTLQRSKLTYLSPTDYFLKTAKVFGDDIPKVRKAFKKKNVTHFQFNEQYQYLEFHVKEIQRLKGLDLEVGISSAVLETRENDTFLRELKVELAYPEEFSITDL